MSRERRPRFCRGLFVSSCPGINAKRALALDIPGIHVFMVEDKQQDVDGRDEPGHDDVGEETSP
jgi:hypothetical protein